MAMNDLATKTDHAMPVRSSERPLRLLLVEDNEDDVDLLLRELRRGHFDVTWERVQTATAMRERLERSTWDLVVSDYSMPEFTALRAIAVLKESGIDLPFIVLSGTITEENAVETLRAGAHDFISKDKLARLLPAVQRPLREGEARKDRPPREQALR